MGVKNMDQMKKMVVLPYDVALATEDELGKYFTRRYQDGWEMMSTYVLGLKLYVIWLVPS